MVVEVVHDAVVPLVANCSGLFIKAVQIWPAFCMTSLNRSLVSYRIASVWFGRSGFWLRVCRGICFPLLACGGVPVVLGTTVAVVWQTGLT